jgi:hypothetical protein
MAASPSFVDPADAVLDQCIRLSYTPGRPILHLYSSSRRPWRVEAVGSAASCRMMLDMLSLGPWPVLFALIGGFAVFVVCMIVIDRKGLEEDWDVIRRLVSAPRFAVGSTSV